MVVSHNLLHLSFPTWAGGMAPAKKDGEKKEGHSLLTKAVTWEYNINIHEHMHGVGFKKCAHWTCKEI